MQRRKQHRSRGYSLPELLTVVGMVGIITLVALPTFLQIIPQYRIRGAASEMAASLRMIRSKAVSTRTPWRMTVDPTNDQYWLEHQIGGAWTPIAENGKPLTAGSKWEKTPGVDLMPAGANIIVTFTRSGEPTAARTIVAGVNNTFVKYNRYTINVDASGNVTVTPSKV